ncbi:hypothetical protein ACIOKD_38330 [Streptomyces sp. NPDC087844]|uniref:hypothetical protein n=1 Tax=Streptomyces sp. NPDC087844 TaxID=3365805 RepID=UPI00380A65DE
MVEHIGVVGGHRDGPVPNGEVPPDPAEVLRLRTQPRAQAVEGGVAFHRIRTLPEGVGVEGVEGLQGDAEPVGHGEDLTGQAGHGGAVPVDEVGHEGVGEGGGGEHRTEAGLGPQISLGLSLATAGPQLRRSATIEWTRGPAGAPPGSPMTSARRLPTLVACACAPP